MFPSKTTTVLSALGALLAFTPAADAAGRHVSTTAKQRMQAASVAAHKAGSPYVWGATGPSSFDCSGLVNYAYRRAGKPLAARTSYDLFRHGVRIRRAGLKRGDLVWTYDRGLGHVGMYLGGGRYVHAPGSGRHVEVAQLPGGGAFVGAVRP
ncbi:MAG: mepH1 [Thermoleophilia bacterium]|nr:mepH1 [Thermoleophilia bacterium]